MILESVNASGNLNAGLELVDASSCQVRNCTFSWNAIGIDASYIPDEDSYPRMNDIFGCSIENNTEFGLHLVSGEFNDVFENHFANNGGYAIRLSQCFICKIYNNTFLNNNGATEVGSPLRQAYDDNDDSNWYLFTENGCWGNGWSNLKNLDADEDGIVDLWYKIGSPYNVAVYDKYPLSYGPKVEAPSAPTDLAVMAFKGYIELTWAESLYSGNSTLASYMVYRGTSPDFSSMFEIETCYGLALMDMIDLTNGQTYYYAVVARNIDGFVSEPSVIVEVYYQPFPMADHSSIYINGNAQFATMASSEEWAGDGSALSPYIISGLTIDGLWDTACIQIINTDVHFVIQDCHLYFGGGFLWGEGSCLVLSDVVNGRIEGCILEYAPGSTVAVASSSVQIVDCDISGQSNVALSLIDSPNCLVTGCTVGQYYCVYVDGSPGCIFSGNTFQRASGESMIAFYLQDSPNCTISGNSMTDGDSFAELRYCNDCVITDNSLSGSAGSFAYLFSSVDVLIARNTITGLGAGTAISVSTTSCTIEENCISGYSTGIRVYYNGNIIANNVLVHNGVGIRISEDSILPSEIPGNRVYGNILEANTGNGLFLDGDVSECEIFDNRFIDNGGFGILAGMNTASNKIYLNYFEGNKGATDVFSPDHIQASDQSFLNLWSWDGLGNYWADWTSPDDDGDGIVDQPYPIAEELTDPAPLASLWGATRSLTMTVGPVYADLTWGDVIYDFTDGIEGYVIYRGTTSGNLVEVGRSATTRYNDTDVTIGTTYYYRVAAYRETVVGPLGPEVSGKPCDVPPAPTEVLAQRGIGELYLTWSAPASDGGSEILGYTIWRGTSPESLVLVATVGVVTSFNDDGLGNLETYYYVVKAFNAAGNGTASAVFSATTYGMPSEPTGVSVQFGDGYTVLSWSAPTDNGGLPVLGYVVYWTTDPLGTWTAVDVGPETLFNHTGLTNGITYYYAVSAVNAVGEGPSSGDVSEVPAQAPSAPQGLELVQGDGEIELTWTAPASNGGSAVVRYVIYRGLTTSSLVHIGDSLGLSYTDASVVNGVVYFYEVRAVNKAGESVGSPIVRGTPGLPMAPTDLVATVIDGAVYLSWVSPQDGGSPLIDHKVYRSGPDGVERFIGHVGNGTWTAFIDPEVYPGSTYSYRVSALTARGEGDMSGSAEAAVPDSTPLPPTGLAIEELNGALVLSWSEAPFSAAATDFWIYRGTASGSLTYFAHTGSGDVLSYEDIAAIPGTTYYYEVRAVNVLGVSGPSEEVSSEIVVILPSAPRDLDVQAGSASVVLT